MRDLVARAAERAAERAGREPSAAEVFHECYTLALTGFRFVPDPAGEELVQPAEVTLEQGLGDCDDASTLVLALARACGLHGRLVILSREVEGGELEALHAYAEVERTPGVYVPADLGSYRGIGEEPSAPVAAVRHRFDLPRGTEGVGFLGGLIGGILGLGAARQQRKAAETAARATVEAQRIENEGLLEVAETQREAVETQAAALTKTELIRGKVRAEELESRERVLGRAFSLVRELTPLLVVGGVLVALSMTLRGRAATKRRASLPASNPPRASVGRPRKTSRRRAAA